MHTGRITPTRELAIIFFPNQFHLESAEIVFIQIL